MPKAHPRTKKSKDQDKQKKKQRVPKQAKANKHKGGTFPNLPDWRCLDYWSRFPYLRISILGITPFIAPIAQNGSIFNNLHASPLSINAFVSTHNNGSLLITAPVPDEPHQENACQQYFLDLINSMPRIIANSLNGYVSKFAVMSPSSTTTTSEIQFDHYLIKFQAPRTPGTSVFFDMIHQDAFVLAALTYYFEEHPDLKDCAKHFMTFKGFDNNVISRQLAGLLDITPHFSWPGAPLGQNEQALALYTSQPAVLTSAIAEPVTFYDYFWKLLSSDQRKAALENDGSVGMFFNACIQVAEKTGFSHGDMHVANVIWDQEAPQENQKLVLIDYGRSYINALPLRATATSPPTHQPTKTQEVLLSDMKYIVGNAVRNQPQIPPSATKPYKDFRGLGEFASRFTKDLVTDKPSTQYDFSDNFLTMGGKSYDISGYKNSFSMWMDLAGLASVIWRDSVIKSEDLLTDKTLKKSLQYDRTNDILTIIRHTNNDDDDDGGDDFIKNYPNNVFDQAMWYFALFFICLAEVRKGQQRSYKLGVAKPFYNTMNGVITPLASAYAFTEAYKKGYLGSHGPHGPHGPQGPQHGGKNCKNNCKIGGEPNGNTNLISQMPEPQHEYFESKQNEALNNQKLYKANITTSRLQYEEKTQGLWKQVYKQKQCLEEDHVEFWKKGFIQSHRFWDDPKNLEAAPPPRGGKATAQPQQVQIKGRKKPSMVRRDRDGNRYVRTDGARVYLKDIRGRYRYVRA